MRLMDGEYYDNKPSGAFYPVWLVTARDSPASDKWHSCYFDNEFEALVWWYNCKRPIGMYKRPGSATVWRDITPRDEP